MKNSTKIAPTLHVKMEEAVFLRTTVPFVFVLTFSMESFVKVSHYILDLKNFIRPTK